MTKQDAVAYYGTEAALGRALGITRASVNAWDEIPIGRQYQLEVVTNGALRADRTEAKQAARKDAA
jgi:hypothetical protein